MKTRLFVAVAGVVLVGLGGFLGLEQLRAGVSDSSILITMRNCSMQPLSAPVVVSCSCRHALFSCDDAGVTHSASVALEKLAEAGDGLDLVAYFLSLNHDGQFCDAYMLDRGIAPGTCEWFRIDGNADSYVSIFSMAGKTNDGFVALDSVRARLIDRLGRFGAWTPLGTWDAGTEANDELQVNIPGFGGEGFNASRDGAEGFVFCHRGLRGLGNTDDAWYDWRGPLAEVMLRIE